MTTYKRRKLDRLTSSVPMFAAVKPEFPLSGLLNRCDERGQDRLILCGSLDDMDRDYCNEPLSNGWELARKFIYKYRSPVYRRAIDGADGEKISVKLAGESWFPGCESVALAEHAWSALENGWSSTGLPLMSTPATTGNALLWQNLPSGQAFPSLSEDLALHIRRITPQHRKQKFATYDDLARVALAQTDDALIGVPLYCYDGRFMYAAMTRRDRYPVGVPRKVGGFREYQPGFYDVQIRIPGDWKKIGLIPIPDYERAEKFGTLGWQYPSEAGATFRAWVCEPELTFAIQQGWELCEVFDGWEFDKGKPLDNWGKKLIEMWDDFRILEKGHRDHGNDFLEAKYKYARAAVREILTNTIGRIHKNTVEREAVVTHTQWRDLIQKWGYANVVTIDKFADGSRRVEHPESNPSDFMIFMPAWSSALYSLARVEVLKYALKIDPGQLVEINGDAIYTTERQKWIEDQDKENKERVGQLRLKGA